MTYNDEYSFSTPYITGDEYILWKGKPDKGNLITSSDIFMIPFSIFWCGFALFWEFMALQSGTFIMPLFGIPFVCVGLYLVFGRFIWNVHIRKKTFYVLTNKKLIRLRGNKIDMLDAKSMLPVQVEIYKNGRGTISFGQTIHYRKGRSYSTPLMQIENVSNIIQVQQAIDLMEK